MLNEQGFDLWADGYDRSVGLSEEDGSYRYLVFLFRAEHFTGELRASGEGEVFWLPLSELSAHPMPSGFPEMLPLFLRDDLSETYHFLADGKWCCENL